MGTTVVVPAKKVFRNLHPPCRFYRGSIVRKRDMGIRDGPREEDFQLISDGGGLGKYAAFAGHEVEAQRQEEGSQWSRLTRT